ncbi:hypothetical protein M9Y10_026355 [Tritrichomonas musculus]|uniref:F5/8 type C domain-containing protein n=1 Tax=Tritrichomonas musculus TaxID=1915356 RepID=A0ABR2H7B6_9EUKA
MQQQNIFKNHDEFPDTNSFSYHGQNYPFKADFFKISSKYFSHNQELLDKKEIIPLLEPFEDDNLDFSEESIKTFIRFVQHKKIQITNENVIQLDFLANKYEVTSLQSATKFYIEQHHQKLVLPLLTTHQNDIKFDTSAYEKVVSQNLSVYIKDKRLLSLKVPVLYRIFKESNSKVDSKEEIDFLFECLEKYKKEASPLFSFVDFGNASGEILNKLLNDYANVFDFHFVNEEMMKSFYQQKSDLIHVKEENKMLQKKYDLLLEEIKNLKSEQTRKLDEINQMHENEINSLKNEMKKTFGEILKSIELKDEKIRKQDLLIQKVVNDNEEIKNKFIPIEEELRKKQEEELRKKQEEELRKKQEEELRKKQEEELRKKQEEELRKKQEEELRKKQEEELRKKQEEELRKKQEEELRKKQEEELKKIKVFDYNSGHEFEGIFNYLNKECGGNSHLKGIINIKSNCDHYKHCYDLIDNQFNDYFYPRESPNSFVEFDFKKYRVSINKYSLKSNKNISSKLINWEIVGSNNKQNWDPIDERHISEWSGSYNVSTYSTQNEEFYEFVQIRLKGVNSDNGYYLILSSIEFFGKIKKMD